MENQAALLTGKDNKKERAAKGKEVAELKAEQQYVDACKIVKGLGAEVWILRDQSRHGA